MNAVVRLMRQHQVQMTSITAQFFCSSLVSRQEIKRKHTQSLEDNMGARNTLSLSLTFKLAF